VQKFRFGNKLANVCEQLKQTGETTGVVAFAVQKPVFAGQRQNQRESARANSKICDGSRMAEYGDIVKFKAVTI
jgi:hypothetical protein